MTGSPWLGLVAGLLAAVLFGGGAVVQAHAVRRLASPPGSLAGFLRASAAEPLILAVVASYLVGFALHAVAIWLLPLYLAQASIAVSLPVTAIASRVIHERLSPVHWWAVGVVTAGLVLLSAGSGEAGPIVTSGSFVAALWVGVALLVLAARARHLVSGGSLGALAGLGYAGSAIGVRGVETPVGWLVVAAALAVPAYGVLGFWLYSLGLDRSAVSSATAPMIVGETFVPAAIGLALLGDGVRAGWWFAVVSGLVLATGGAILLAREVRSPDATESSSSPGPAPQPGR